MSTYQGLRQHRRPQHQGLFTNIHSEGHRVSNLILVHSVDMKFFVNGTKPHFLIPFCFIVTHKSSNNTVFHNNLCTALGRLSVVGDG